MKPQQPLLRALSVPPEKARTLVVAYSGGRDSTTLLYALAHLGLGPTIRAVHVCHHLEADAVDWAEHCATFCDALGIGLSRLGVRVDVRGDGLEAAARKARYSALERHIQPGEVLVTAHHAEDQAETFLLQALRGAGMAGLAAMPRLASFGRGRLWRPWLTVERSQITAYAEAQSLDWVEDQSNADTRYARAWLRKQVWPKLTARWPAAARTLSRSAAWAGQAADAIATLAGIDLDEARADHDSLNIDALAALSEARVSEVLRRWLAERQLDPADHRHIVEIRRMMMAREHNGPRVVFADTEVRRFNRRLFGMARLSTPPQAGQKLEWPNPDRMALPAGCGHLGVRGTQPPCWPADLSIIFRCHGARLLLTHGKHERLSEILRRQRVPPWIRERIPLIYIGATLVAVPGRWRHPKLHQWFGGWEPVFVWHHALVGEPERVVGLSALG